MNSRSFPAPKAASCLTDAPHAPAYSLAGLAEQPSLGPAGKGILRGRSSGRSQIIFWLIGATDGHAKNASIFLGPEGRFQLTPFYDVLSAQPSLDSRQIERKQMKLAMSVGDSRHYRVDEIRGRHFVQTAMRAGLSRRFAAETLEIVAGSAKAAFEAVEAKLPAGFPMKIHTSIKAGALRRLTQMA